MDLYLIALICLTSAATACVTVAVLLHLDERRAIRERERHKRQVLAAANNEVSRRPRVPASFPLPSLNQGSK